jgi:hypothetical protein
MGGRCRRRVGWRETGGKPDPRTRPDLRADGRISAAQRGCGRDRIRTCVGNAGDFTGRTAVSPRIPSHPHLVRSSAVTSANDARVASVGSRRPHPFRSVPCSRTSGGAKVERIPGRHPQIPCLQGSSNGRRATGRSVVSSTLRFDLFLHRLPKEVGQGRLDGVSVLPARPNGRRPAPPARRSLLPARPPPARWSCRSRARQAG